MEQRTGRPGAWALVVKIEALTRKLMGRTSLALADALGFGRVEGTKLPSALTLLLSADLLGACERPFERRLQLHLGRSL
jgi:hypothetical protein